MACFSTRTSDSIMGTPSGKAPTPGLTRPPDVNWAADSLGGSDDSHLDEAASSLEVRSHLSGSGCVP